jgi:hypothetical protein
MRPSPLICPNCGATAWSKDLFCGECRHPLGRVFVHRPINGLIRAAYTLTTGFWVGGLLIAAGYLLCVSVVGLFAARRVFALAPQALFLDQGLALCDNRGRPGQPLALTPAVSPQRRWFVRAPFFLLVGLWAGALWLALGWALGVTVVGQPLARFMLERAWTVLTLYRR